MKRTALTDFLTFVMVLWLMWAAVTWYKEVRHYPPSCAVLGIVTVCVDIK